MELRSTGALHVTCHMIQPMRLTSPSNPAVIYPARTDQPTRTARLAIVMKPDISVVIPLRNESPNVAPWPDGPLKRCATNRVRLELILVDMAAPTTPGTASSKRRAPTARVRGLRHVRSFGQSAALWTGFKASREDIIATLDGDLQNDPDDLPGDAQRSGHLRYVCGVRRSGRTRRLRRISSAEARRARKDGPGGGLSVTAGCNLRVFKRAGAGNAAAV